MAVNHGKNAILYLGATTAIAVAETNDINIQGGADLADATAHGATTKKYIPGVTDFQVGVSKFYDDVYFAMIDAALNTTAMKAYLYPSRATAAIYFYFTGYLSMDGLGFPVGDMAGEEYTLVPGTAVGFIHP